MQIRLLRFYDDSLVIGTNVGASLDDISIVLTWFNRFSDRKWLLKGRYEMNEDKYVAFVLGNGRGKTFCSGEFIKDDELLLYSHSHKTGHFSKEIYQRFRIASE